MPKPYLGFDIGTSAIHLALCSGSTVKRLINEPLPEGLVRDGTIVSMEAMADFIRDLRKTHRLRTRDCALILPARLNFCRRLTLPPMTIDQLKLNLPYEFRDYLAQEKDKYFYDYSVVELKRDEDGTPRELDLMAAAVLKSTIADYSAMFHRASLRLKAAMPVELAYINLLHRYLASHPDEAEQGHCLVDFGHTATRVYMFRGSRFEVLRTIDRGCALLASAVADALNIDEHIAHTYLLTNHNDVQSLDICQTFYHNLAVEIMKAVNFYAFSNGGSALSALYYCGGGAQIKPLLDIVSGMVDLSVQSADTLLSRSSEDETGTALSPAAIGAALM